MDPTDPTDLDPLLRDSPDVASDGADDVDEATAATAQDRGRFTVRSEWSMVRVSKKRWFGR